ncbi:hypothetical protein JTE90_006271 [Oedothorax gibbosus]|uniref:Transposase n=1 Tax=Oedothorax gibbosus TaxID=931172 RepID=A0AAV6U7V3_9ARAC|nr:hypothetical protein JTE90_006271 [Oedothorax gibbosus]
MDTATVAYNLIWSDESRFQLFHADGRWEAPCLAHPSGRDGSSMPSGHSPGQWPISHGCGVHFRGMEWAPLVVLDATLTGQRYLQLLADPSPPFCHVSTP